MAAAGSTNWEVDTALKNDLANYVCQGMQRSEILDYMKRDYFYYNWSVRTLDRRLRFFDIYYIDKDVTVDEAREAVQTELNGPGCLLGYRAMQQKIRQNYKLRISRDKVYDLMYEADYEGLEKRRPGF